MKMAGTAARAVNLAESSFGTCAGKGTKKTKFCLLQRILAASLSRPSRCVAISSCFFVSIIALEGVEGWEETLNPDDSLYERRLQVRAEAIQLYDQYRALLDFPNQAEEAQRVKRAYEEKEAEAAHILKQIAEWCAKHGTWMGISFSEGLGRVRVGRTWGFIDTKGEMVIPPQFQRIDGFSEGRAAFFDGSKWGFIDRTGKVVVAARYAEVLPFSAAGLAAVRDNERWGFIDRVGNIAIEPSFDLAYGFTQNPKLAAVKSGGKWGFINAEGDFVIAPNFDWAGGFVDGLAAVAVGNLWGYINLNGAIAIKPQFSRAGAFSNGLALVQPVKGNAYLINKQGMVAIKGKFDIKSVFSGDRAPVFVRDLDGYSIIDTSGKFVTERIFNNVWDFSDGLAGVEIDGMLGYVDGDGEFVIPPRFENFSPFHDGLAAVKEGERWGYIDKKGKYIWRQPEQRK